MTIQVPPDSTGKLVDATSMTQGAVVVERQLINISGASGTAEVVVVTDATPAAGDMGLVVRQAGPVSVVGQVSITNNLNISAIAAVAISGTAIVAFGSPQTINNISAAVTVQGNISASIIGNINISNTPSVILATGANNIGTINNISASVTVQGNVNISAMPNVTISAMPNVSATIINNINISAMPAVNISATANVAVTRVYASPAVPSASRGPRCIIASTSANTTLIAAPGANLAIYITGLQVSNASGSNTRARVGTSASIGQVQMMMAASGGGFVTQYDPPWKLSTNEALVGSVKPNASEGIFNIHFFVASADAL